jgi:hypothetical protein
MVFGIYDKAPAPDYDSCAVCECDCADGLGIELSQEDCDELSIPGGSVICEACYQEQL